MTTSSTYMVGFSARPLWIKCASGSLEGRGGHSSSGSEEEQTRTYGLTEAFGHQTQSYFTRKQAWDSILWSKEP